MAAVKRVIGERARVALSLFFSFLVFVIFVILLFFFVLLFRVICPQNVLGAHEPLHICGDT